MRLRSHRRSLVVWGLPAGRAGGYAGPGLMRPARAGRIRRSFRIAALVTVIGLMRVARGVRPRWRPLLAGGVLTVAGIVLRGSWWGAITPLGLWFLLYALLIPAIPDADRRRRSELKRELAAYSTPAQRCDLEATLDRYPDDVTRELRAILADQTLVACGNGIPGTERR